MDRSSYTRAHSPEVNRGEGEGVEGRAFPRNVTPSKFARNITLIALLRRRSARLATPKRFHHSQDCPVGQF